MTDVRLAWVEGEAIEAVRGDDGIERLYVEGREVPLTASHHHPSQQVINYCMGGKRARKAMHMFWLNLIREG